MRNANETTIATLLMPFRALKSNGVVLKDDPVINLAIFRALYLGYLGIKHIFDVWVW